MYLQINSYTKYWVIEPYHDGSYIEAPQEVIEIDRDNIEVPPDFDESVKNIVSDANETRDKSYENYSENKSRQEVANDIKALEEQMRNEAGGSAERERLHDLIEDRKNQQMNTENSNHQTVDQGGDVAYAGKTMVDFSLAGREPFQNNRWYIRNPGYTCGTGMGTIVVDIRVNGNGNVTNASYNSGKSRGGNGCMIEQAVKYAEMSRFNYSGSAPKAQSGTITYIFVSQ